MENIDIIQESTDYIEQNLKGELNAEVLAKRAAFSVFYYYRIFQSLTGLPVMQYIQKRKLLHAIYEIGIGRLMLMVEAEYGFKTHAGFYKAFKKEFGCSPTTYFNIHKAKKPFKINLKQEEPYVVLSNQITCYAYFSQFDKFEELKNINKNITLWLYENIDCLDIFGGAQ